MKTLLLAGTGIFIAVTTGIDYIGNKKATKSNWFIVCTGVPLLIWMIVYSAVHRPDMFRQFVVPLLSSGVILWTLVPILLDWKGGKNIAKSMKLLAIVGTICASYLIVIIFFKVFF